MPPCASHDQNMTYGNGQADMLSMRLAGYSTSSAREASNRRDGLVRRHSDRRRARIGPTPWRTHCPSRRLDRYRSLPRSSSRGGFGGHEAGGESLGISPSHSREEHVELYESPTEPYTAIAFAGSGLMGPEVDNIHSSDFVIFIAGRSGSWASFASRTTKGSSSVCYETPADSQISLPRSRRSSRKKQVPSSFKTTIPSI